MPISEGRLLDKGRLLESGRLKDHSRYASCLAILVVKCSNSFYTD